MIENFESRFRAKLVRAQREHAQEASLTASDRESRRKYDESRDSFSVAIVLAVGETSIVQAAALRRVCNWAFDRMGGDWDRASQLVWLHLDAAAKHERHLVVAMLPLGLPLGLLVWWLL